MLFLWKNYKPNKSLKMYQGKYEKKRRQDVFNISLKAKRLKDTIGVIKKRY